MTTEQAKFLIQTDEHFICSKRYGNNIDRLAERYPDGAPDRIVAAAFLMTEDDVEKSWRELVEKLRDYVGVEDLL